MNSRAGQDPLGSWGIGGVSRAFLPPSPGAERKCSSPSKGPATGEVAPGPAGTHLGLGRGAQHPRAGARHPDMRPPASAGASSVSPCCAHAQGCSPASRGAVALALAGDPPQDPPQPVWRRVPRRAAGVCGGPVREGRGVSRDAKLASGD